MSDTFKSDQFDWLRQVAADASLVPAAARVAIALTRYFSRKHGGAAWMSQATIGHDLGMPARTVGRALAGLVKRGHLVTKRRGKMETNLYHLVLKNSAGDRQISADHDRPPMATHDTPPTADHDRPPVATHPRVIGQNEQSDRPKPVKVIGHPWLTNPMNEPYEEPNEVESDSLQLDFVEEDSGRRQEVDPQEVARLERLEQQEERREKRRAEIQASFEVFWKQYPKRVAELAALEAYRTVISRKRATPEELLAGAQRYAAERSGQNSRYTKHPATWLKGGCWADEPASIGGIPYGSQPESPHIAVSEQIARQLMERDGGHVQ